MSIPLACQQGRRMLEPRGFGLCVLSVFHRGDERNPGREQSRVLFNERSCVLCWHCVYNHIRSRDGLLHGWEKSSYEK